MKLSQLIKHLERLEEKHGNLLVLDCDQYSVGGVHLRTGDPDDYPKDWNMPKEWVEISSNR